MEVEDLQQLSSCDCMLVFPNYKGHYEIWANLNKDYMVWLDKDDFVKTLSAMFPAIRVPEVLKALMDGNIVFVGKENWHITKPRVEEPKLEMPTWKQVTRKGGLTSTYKINPLFGTRS